jgi:uncharacterized protein (TIGR03084 family)
MDEAAGTGRRTIDALADDLEEEYAELHLVVVDLDAAAWETPTPAAGWRIRQQIAHLAFVDGRAALAIRDGAAFAQEKAIDQSSHDSFEERSLEWAADLAPEDLLARWSEARDDFLSAARHAPDGVRVPWYGPDMAVPTKVTARIMETWAHGQDVVDALGVSRRPTARLRHVASIGVRTRAFSYAIRGQLVPDDDVYVELAGPDSAVWTWGEPQAINAVRGPAEDFCLVVTQRRHVADTNLQVTGDSARSWMLIAQAFAGAPGPGRTPGEYRIEPKGDRT